MIAFFFHPLTQINVLDAEDVQFPVKTEVIRQLDLKAGRLNLMAANALAVTCAFLFVLWEQSIHLKKEYRNTNVAVFLENVNRQIGYENVLLKCLEIVFRAL